MKLLVLSDSHSSLRFMRQAIEKLKPDWVAHLGDYYENGTAMAEEFPNIPFYIVPGNCDQYRMSGLEPEILCPTLAGVRIYMTHGHNHRVKLTLTGLVSDAKKAEAQVCLYGHTHVADCHIEDGIWVVNPGSCGHSGGSVALLELNQGQVLGCKILTQAQWEEIE